ncbi:MAG: N-methyl-L-tryptophan oxidase [Terracidiphilus sp.]
MVARRNLLESTLDTIVVGLGAMGSATAYHLAKRHARVLGLDSFTPAHNKGSSHGESRIIRQAYFEAPAYVPLVLRAYELWDQLQQESKKELLFITGGLAIGAENERLVGGCLKSATEHGIPHQVLDVREMARRYSQFSLAETEVAFYEEKAGYLKPEECIRQHLNLASKWGADLRFGEPVLSWTASNSGDGVTVKTEKQTYRAKSLVFSVGAWFAQFAHGFSMPVAVSRRVMFWFKPVRDPRAFDAGVFPIFLWEPERGPLFYGFPRIAETGHPKVAIHSEGDKCTPSKIDRVIHARDELAIRSAIESRIPALNGEVLHASTCMYTMTTDEHFIIDAHPDFPQVIFAAGFSGHGFKFSSVVGEILSELATTRRTSSDISLFSGSRLRPSL